MAYLSILHNLIPASLPVPLSSAYEVVTSTPFLISLAISSVLQVTFYHAFSYFFRQPIATERQKAWILTLFSSVVMSILSLYSFRKLLNVAFDIEALGGSLVNDGVVSKAMVGFFITYLINDLVLGTMYYRDQINFLTGWFHHTFYFFLLTHLIHTHYATIFLLFCIMEVPTAVLALGHLQTKLRNDNVFGVTFFTTRVLFHAIMIVYLFTCYKTDPVWLYALGVYPLHLYWFYGWIQQQRRGGTVKRKIGNAVQEVSINGTPIMLTKDFFSESYQKTSPSKINTNKFGKVVVKKDDAKENESANADKRSKTPSSPKNFEPVVRHCRVAGDIHSVRSRKVLRRTTSVM